MHGPRQVPLEPRFGLPQAALSKWLSARERAGWHTIMAQLRAGFPAHTPVAMAQRVGCGSDILFVRSARPDRHLFRADRRPEGTRVLGFYPWRGSGHHHEPADLEWTYGLAARSSGMLCLRRFTRPDPNLGMPYVHAQGTTL